MGAAVLPFPQRRDPPRWQVDEIAECYRVIDILCSVGMSVALEADVSDEGDPWLVFVREDSQDVIIHITRIAGQVIAASAASDKLFRGRSLRDVLQRILHAQPFVLPASRPLGVDDRLLMHPATLLVAVVATAFLASQESATLAGDGEAAFMTSEATTEGDPAGAENSKQPVHIDMTIPGRAAPASDTHISHMTTVASAVMAAVAIIAGGQMLRPADFLSENTHTFSFSEVGEGAKHAADRFLTSGIIGIDTELELLDWQIGRSVLASEDARQPALETQSEQRERGSAPAGASSDPQIADKGVKSFSVQAALHVSSVQLNAQDAANPLTFAVQPAPLTLKADFGLNGPVTGAEISIGTYSPNILSGSMVVVKSVPLADPVAASSLLTRSVSDGSSSQLSSAHSALVSPLSGLLALSPSQAVSSLAALAVAGSPASPTQIASSDGGITSNNFFVTDFSASFTGPKSTLAKMAISVSDLFWHGAITMRSMGIDVYNNSRSGSIPSEVGVTSSLSEKNNSNIFPDTSSMLSGQTHLNSDLLTKTASNGPFKSAAVTDITGATSLESLAITSKQPLEATAVGKTTSDIVQTTDYSVVATASTLSGTSPITPSRAEPPSIESGSTPIRSAAEIVQAVQSIVSFAFDPRHEIVLKGQDLEILQILVRANPLIAGADRVLLSHGQILAGDGVMLMPGVALLPAEVFAPKLVASLPTIKEGALEIFFRDDLTVTLAGVIDI